MCVRRCLVTSLPCLPYIYTVMPCLFLAMPSVLRFHFHSSRLEQLGQQSNSNLACINIPQPLQNKEFTVIMTLI